MQISYESSNKWCRNVTDAEFGVCKLATNPLISDAELPWMRCSLYANELRILYIRCSKSTALRCIERATLMEGTLSASDFY